MADSFRIGAIEVDQGTKKWASLNVAERPLTSINVPITIVNGVRSGPVLCVIAGEHPNEYAGIEACIRLSRTIRPEELTGKLLILPVINVPGFESRTPYVSPLDRVNLSITQTRWSRKPSFPSISHIMLYNLYNSVITKSDYLIRLHGGDICESMIPCTYITKPKSGKTKTFDSAKNLAKAFSMAGIKYIVEYDVQAELEEELEIPTIGPETGGEGKLEEEDVTILYNGVLNVMKYLRMIDGELMRVVEPKIAHNSGFVSTERGGLFYAHVKVGDIVSKGDILGEIRNIKGETLEELEAPQKGMIFFKSNPLPWDASLGWFLFHIVDVEE